MEAPEKLKPCPFCGNEASRKFTGNDRTKTRKVTISCNHCHATLVVGAMRFNHQWCDEKVTERWNTRARAVPGELVEELYKVASTWLRHIDRQKERAETLTRAASLARKGDIDGARRLKAQVDSAPRVYDGANMEPVMRKFKAWHEWEKQQ